MLTDYPDTALLENLQHNVNLNLSCSPGSRVFVKVFVSLTLPFCYVFDSSRDMFGENQLPTYLRCYRTKMRGSIWYWCQIWFSTTHRFAFDLPTLANDMFSGTHSMMLSWRVAYHYFQQQHIALQQPCLYSSHTTGHTWWRKIWIFLRKQKSVGLQRR